MMDFSLTEAQTALSDKAQTFGEEQLNRDLVARDAHGLYQHDVLRGLWSRIADYGLLGLCAPAALGGAGHDVRTAAAILHGLGRGCRDNGLLLGINAQIWTIVQPILEFGSEEQKARYIPGILNGSIVGADAITELASGSDAMALGTSARKDGGDYVLNGEKAFIGMAPACDVALVFASTNPAAGGWGISVFLVDGDTPGMTVGDEMPKLGTRTLPMGYLSFHDCRVPESARLGPEGAGQAIFARSSEWERQMILVSHVGAMRRQLDACVAYARGRKVFGKPIDQHQSVGNRLAEMRLRYETSWLMQMRAAWAMDTGHSDTEMAALTKLHISEAYLASSLDAVRTLGGQGYLAEADVARDLRDALGGVIYGGTSDIQRHIIARAQGRS